VRQHLSKLDTRGTAAARRTRGVRKIHTRQVGSSTRPRNRALPPERVTKVSRHSAAVELQRVLFRVRRAVRTRLRGEGGEPEIPEAQAEVVHLLYRTPGLRVQEVANRLSLASNTASTLVGQLITAGLVKRRRDAADARAARLHITPAAIARVARRRDRGATVLEEAMELLDRKDRGVLVGATPALQRLLTVIEDPPQT
jgi:DNA-binding MarR family transcriptional regulator